MTTLFINIKELIQIEDFPKLFVSGKEMKVLPTIKNAFLFIEDDLIKDFGEMNSLPNSKYDKKIDVSGKITAQGEEVKIVYVDGKEY
jgi:imidazolonepropionase